MTSDLFDTSITIIPGKFSQSNRRTQFNNDVSSKVENVPALITVDYKVCYCYLEMSPNFQVRRGDVIINEANSNKYTVDDIAYINDMYKLKLSEKDI